MEQYLTVAQAADRRGVSRETIYQAIKAGRLPVAMRLGRHAALRPSDVDALVIYPPNDQRAGRLFPGGRGRPKESLK